MKVLVACEESQEVCKAFRERGHEAFSCDILECSGGHPEWHLKMDVLPLLSEYWDLIIAHPPCTYLTVAGNRWFNVGRYGNKALERLERRREAVAFFMHFVYANAPRIAIENPIGIMSRIYRKPDQIIQPYQYGHPERKSTCLWLKNLPLLKPTKIVDPIIINYTKCKGTDSYIHYNTMFMPEEERRKIRSKTFHGIALAMADQWG